MVSGAGKDGAKDDNSYVTKDHLALILGNALQAYDDEIAERCVEQVNAAIGAAKQGQATQPPTEAANTSTDALLREIRDLKMEISSFKKDGGGGGGGGKRDNKSQHPQWQTTKRGDKITHDNLTWWWCPQHRQGNGCYVRHKPSDHSKWVESKKRQKNDPNAKTFVSTD